MKRVLLLAFLLFAVPIAAYWYQSQDYFYRFKDLSGPSDVSIVEPPTPAKWEVYATGSDSRMAVLLTDTTSDWMALAHGLKTIGIPFMMTTDYQAALKHKVVYVFPNITGRNLSADALGALSAFPSKGGTLIAQQVFTGALKNIFNYEDVVPNKNATQLLFSAADAATSNFTDPDEKTLKIGSAKNPALGAYSYVAQSANTIATYQDGTPAILRNAAGTAYALGFDIGYFLQKGYNNRQQDIATSYVNAYEPTLDVMLRFLKNVYIKGQQSGVTLWTVPHGKALTVQLTHDIDYTKSLLNAVQYAAYESENHISATYFMQVKYVRDWNDDIFFTDEGTKTLSKIRAMNMEIASHSIAHSQSFDKFEMGTGKEAYPNYVPFVKDKNTTVGGTILGELRVSKFLLDHFEPERPVVSFRPGHLRDPYILPQALAATHYLFSSSVTANDSITHLPFQLTYGRDTIAEVPVFEFPITVEDLFDPPMLDRLPQAIVLAEKLKKYGALFNILIHPDVIGQKFAFEKGFVEAMGDSAWYGSVAQFGQFWTARDQIGIDVQQNATQLNVQLSVPQPVDGLTLQLPAKAQFVSCAACGHAEQKGGFLIIDHLSTDASVLLSVQP